MRLRVLLAILTAGLLTSGCTTSHPSHPKKAEVTTTTVSEAKGIVAARTYFTTITKESQAADARDAKALAAAPVMTQQIANAYTQFSNDTLRYQLEIARYHWPRSVASDAHNLVMALAALAADWQSAASKLPTPNYNLDNDNVIADPQLLSADLGINAGA